MPSLRSAAYDWVTRNSMAVKPLSIAIGTLLLLLAASCSKPGSAETRQSADAADSLPVLAVQRVALSDLSRSVALTAEFTPYGEVDVISNQHDDRAELLGRPENGNN